MHRTLCLVFLVLVLPSVVSAAAPPPADDDRHDLVVLHPRRPFRLRFHLQVGGRSFQAGWNQQVSRLFGFLDRDGNGVLDRKEAGRAPSREQWRQISVGQGALEPDGAPDFLALARGKKGVTRDDLQAYYRTSTAGPLQTRWGWRQGIGGDPLAETLWRKLDTNADGKLSRVELLAARRVLGTLDRDDDEVVTIRELMGPNFAGTPLLFATSPAHGPADHALPFYSLRPGEPGKPLVTALVKRYDTDRSGTLAAREIGLPEKTFARLDQDGNGQLDPGELSGWLEQPADLELVVPLDGPALPLRVVGKPGDGLRYQVDRQGEAIALGDWLIELTRPAPARTRAARRSRSARDLFGELDRDSSGYLDDQEIYTPPFSHVAWMRLADSDGDGKISEREFTAFADLQGSIQGRVTFLRTTSLGRSLFRLLDQDGDARLGPRELNRAWPRLEALAGGRGEVTATDLPVLYRLTLGHGPLEASSDELRTSTVPRRGRSPGPAWFRKMDGNGDGDVSLREWLGSTEQFRTIDTDGDGLISVEEADRADRWFRAGR